MFNSESMKNIDIDPFAKYHLLKEQSICLPFQIRGQGREQQMQELLVRLYMSRQDETGLMVFLSNHDLFFYYDTHLGRKDVADYTRKYGLKVSTVEELLMAVGEGLEQARVQMDGKRLKLILVKQFGGKQFTLMTIQATQQSSQQTTILAAYRYATLRQQINNLEWQINDAKQVIRCRNPYLLSYIKKQ